MQLGDFDPHLHPQFGIEIAERLVEKKDLRIADDSAADGDALALPARKLRRLALEILLEPQDPGRARNLLGDLGLWAVRHAQPEAHIVRNGHVRVERVGLEHHRHAAVGRLLVGDVAARR